MLTEQDIREAIQKAYGEWTEATEGSRRMLTPNLVTLMVCHVLDKQKAAQRAE